MACTRCGYASAYGATDCPRCRGGFGGMSAQEARSLQDAGEQAGGCLMALGSAAVWIGISRPMSLVWAAVMLFGVTTMPAVIFLAPRLPEVQPGVPEPLIWDLIPLWYLVPATVAPLVLTWMYRERIMEWRKWIFAAFVLLVALSSCF
jgi:hypothetical protein